MSYVAIYRKYRPVAFDEVIGQEAICRMLTNQIGKGTVGHAYLFNGARGTGKTSVAKIFARAINCENTQNGSPCGVCLTCKALSEQNSMDVLEIDAASNNSVDQVRELRENVQYPPVFAKYKVYIIDEVHMLSGAAFNALLKTLEEPPSHAVFILATTEIHKIPATIRSRCMRFDFRLVPIGEVADRIKYILKDMGREYEEEAVSALAKAGDGCVRDSLSMLDMCLSYSAGKLTYSDVVRVIGVAEDERIRSVAESILSGRAGDAVSDICSLLDSGKTAGLLCNDLMKSFRDLCVVKLLGKNANGILSYPADVFGALLKTGELASYEKILRGAELFTSIEGELKNTTQPRALLETAVMRASRPDDDFDGDALFARIAELEKSLDEIKKSGINVAVQAVSAQKTDAATDKPREGLTQSEKSLNPKQTPSDEFDGVPDFSDIPLDVDAPPISDTYSDDFACYSLSSSAANRGASQSQTQRVSSGEAKDVKKIWGSVIRRMRTEKHFMLFPICGEASVSFEDGACVITASNRSECEVMELSKNREIIRQYLADEGIDKYAIRCADGAGSAVSAERQASVRDHDEEMRRLFGDKFRKK